MGVDTGPGRIDIAALQDWLSAPGDVHIAIGPTADGVDGFRRSHLDALTTQQMMARLRSPQPVARFTDIQFVALLTADPDRAGDFVRQTLGDLESAGRELQETVRCSSPSSATPPRGAALHPPQHPAAPLACADELLPRPLAESTVPVAVALEVVRWRG